MAERTINFKAPELNVAHVTGFTSRKDYWIPILISLIDLGEEQFHDGEKIRKNIVEKKYVVLTAEDEDSLPLKTETRFSNEHAFALVGLQKELFIEKPRDSDAKIYKITKDGVEYLNEQGIIL